MKTCIETALKTLEILLENPEELRSSGGIKMADNKNGLDVRSLLKETYSELCRRHNAEEIRFQKKVLAEIADDSDYESTRAGYMGYKSAALFNLSGKVYAIAVGEACGRYPADPYNSDILALEFSAEGKTPEQLQENLTRAIERSTYFRNSLAYGIADGSVWVNPNGRFKRRLLNIINPKIESFVAQEPQYTQDYYSLSIVHLICEKTMLYKPEFAVFLADSIEKVLK